MTRVPKALGEFEQLLLLAVLRLQDGAAWGVPIREEIERRTGRTVSAGAVYTTLDRLTERQLVTSRLGQPTPERGGKRRRLYRLAPAGARALNASLAALRNMSRGLQPRLDVLTAAQGRGRSRKA